MSTDTKARSIGVFYIVWVLLILYTVIAGACGVM